MPIKITVDCRELKLIEEIKRLMATEVVFKDKIELLTEKKLSEDEIIKNLQAERDMNFELVKTGKNRYGVEQNLSNELKISSIF
jgi:hypothetical protein